MHSRRRLSFFLTLACVAGCGSSSSTPGEIADASRPDAVGSNQPGAPDAGTPEGGAQPDAHSPICQGSLSTYCQNGSDNTSQSCGRNLPTVLAGLRASCGSLVAPGPQLARNCGGLDELVDGTRNDGTVAYYEPVSGALVAIDDNSNSRSNCVAGPANFVRPTCDPSDYEAVCPPPDDAGAPVTDGGGAG
jgi:hypothetical protein